MRRSGVLGVLVMVIGVVLGPAPALATDPPVLRSYEGTTSAGDVIRIFTTARDGGVVRFLAAGIEGAASCDDGTTIAFAHGLDLGPRGVVLTGSGLDVEGVGFSEATFLEGTLGSKAGSGTITHLFAALDATEEPMLCTTGELTWTVDRIVDQTAARMLERLIASADTLVSEPSNGLREISRLAPVTDDATVALRERLRSYEGRTSAHDPLFVVTSKRPEGVVLLELGFGWELACDDGATLGLGFFILFAGEPLDPGRLDYHVTAPELALHVGGRLGPHTGSGTTSSVVPALTADLQAQACRSGELDWRAWRTDPGASRARGDPSGRRRSGGHPSRTKELTKRSAASRSAAGASVGTAAATS